jgi:hypothetical protein
LSRREARERQRQVQEVERRRHKDDEDRWEKEKDETLKNKEMGPGMIIGGTEKVKNGV